MPKDGDAIQLDRQRWCMLEFEALRNELDGRIRFLHQTINLAIVFWCVLLIAVFYFISCDLNRDLLVTFILIIPIVFDLLGYNYQSNQNSLESIANYIYEVVRPRAADLNGREVLAWEKYFAAQKEPFKIESSTKVFPFILPSVIPIVLLALRVPLSDFQRLLSYLDIALLCLMAENFRYKLRRVK